MPKREAPAAGFHFALEFDGKIQAYFTECSGLGSEHEVTEAQAGAEGGPEAIIKIPGRLKWENITLKRGISNNKVPWDWRKQVIDGDVTGARKNGSIVMYDRKGKETARWNFRRAWPVKVSISQIKSDGNETISEELTITHEYIERVN